jgi:hypothetical protein
MAELILMTKMREDFEGHVSFRDYLLFKFLLLPNTSNILFLLFVYFDTVILCIVYI